jgi:hypothetical protein
MFAGEIVLSPMKMTPPWLCPASAHVLSSEGMRFGTSDACDQSRTAIITCRA